MDNLVNSDRTNPADYAQLAYRKQLSGGSCFPSLLERQTLAAE
jgi:hypothetical protein